MIGIILAFLISVYLITDTIIEYKKLKEIEPMGKVLCSQAINEMDIVIIYNTLELQIKLNNQMIKNPTVPKEKIEEIKEVNKETKKTLKKIKAIVKETGIEI